MLAVLGGENSGQCADTAGQACELAQELRMEIAHAASAPGGVL